jgi:hypothetical protein
VTQPDPVKTFPTRRIKAIDGMAVTAEVWEEAHNYHRQQMELHTLLSHGPGIVTGLQVMANDPADNAVYILPGIAVDPGGHAIVLNEPLTYEIGSAAEGRLYLLITYGESQSRAGNGHMQEGAPLYVQSQFSLGASSTLPATPHVELARLVRAGRGAPIADARDPAAPGPNEIDLRFRRAPAIAPAPAGIAVAHLGGAGADGAAAHARGVSALAAGWRARGHGPLWVDDGARLEAGLETYGLVYLVGHGAFRLSQNEMNALYAYLQAGGTVLAESCRREAGGAAAAEAAFADLFASMGLRLEHLPAGHALLREPSFFNTAPLGFETATAPAVQTAPGLVYTTADYGCLWQGERRSGFAAREEIRAAHEFGENVVHLALARARQRAGA